MFDILVYLFETYYQPENCPAPAVLARKLTAVGFEQDDISAALDWLSGLESRPGAEALAASRGARIFSADECARLTTEALSFIIFLEQAGVLDAPLRELVVERALALSEPRIPLSKLKIIVLMVLWRKVPAPDSLLLEELLAEDDDERPYH